MQKTIQNIGPKASVVTTLHGQTMYDQFPMTNGFHRSPKGQRNAGPTPLPRAEDLNSDQSPNSKDRMQRLTVSRGRKLIYNQVYENNKSDTPDEIASPLIYRLDSQHSYRP